MDQILLNFDPLPPSSGQLWSFYIIPTLSHVTKRGLSADPIPPYSCPHSYLMPPYTLQICEQKMILQCIIDTFLLKIWIQKDKVSAFLIR